MGVVGNDCGHPGHKVNGWMNGWSELIFHADANSGKLRITLIVFGWLWSKMDMGLISMNEWRMNLAECLHGNTSLRKLKVTL